jgi:hypothetical protein
MDGDIPTNPSDSGNSGEGQGKNVPGPGGSDQGVDRQELRHSPVSARVPERIGRGVLSNGVAVLDSPTEFIIDFFQGLSRPPLIVARVVMAPRNLASFHAALRENFDRYAKTFGAPPPLPPPPAQRPSIQEIYDTYRLPEELLSGGYSNSVMITHSPSEFGFDFITGFFPTAAVSSRVFMAAPHVPRVIAALNNAMKQFEQRYQIRLLGDEQK